MDLIHKTIRIDKTLQRIDYKFTLKYTKTSNSIRTKTLLKTAIIFFKNEIEKKLKSRINTKIISKRLAHSTLAFTLDTYNHVSTKMQKRDE